MTYWRSVPTRTISKPVMGGTAAKLVAKGRSVLFVDLCDGEPTRHGEPASARPKQLAPPPSSVSIGTRCRFATD
jgi:hypothetical protein